MNKKPVRLVDIAKKANVTAMTVSLALNKSSRISDKTRTRIQKIAAEMGYRPDPAAKALKEKASLTSAHSYIGTIALVISKAFADERRMNPLCEARDRMLESYCRDMGYHLDRFEVGPSEIEQQSLNRVLTARGIRGLFLYGSNEEIHTLRIDWSKYAAVAYSSSLHEHFIHNIMSSSYQDAYDLMKEVKKLGYKRPGCFVPLKKYEYLKSGFSAGLSLWQKNGKSALFNQWLADDQNVIKTQFFKWFQQYNPDVVITVGTLTYQDMADSGQKIPQQTGYACIDVPDGQLHVSGMIQHRDFACKTMIDILHGMLTRNEYGSPAAPMCIQIPSSWNPGNTLCLQKK